MGAQGTRGVRHGFLLGKFMPPHAGHLMLCRSAATMVDRLTVLVCSLPDDPVPGALRLAWMRELLPEARVIGHDAVVPQRPEDDSAFWPIWRRIVAQAHPEPIDLLFAGEAYGTRLAQEVGGTFVPLGARVLGADAAGLGGLSGSAIRADPFAHWRWLPEPVRGHFAQTIVLHGVESTGKSVLAERLAAHFGTIWVPEYGRTHAEVHGIDMDESDLLLMGEAQAAMIAAGRRLCERRLFADTDALMTAAWAAMMIGREPPALLEHPRADLYLHCEPDVPWMDDGTRIYGDPDVRLRFDRLCREVLGKTGVRQVRLGGSWDQRFSAAVAAIEALPRPSLPA
jgi:HTH-type transcriptional repressor of NAD biosynthesis genes